MTTFRAPALDKAAPIVDPHTGRITPYFQRFWQNLSFTAETVNNGKVDQLTSTGWSAASGASSQASFATYAAPVISNPPTQAEVQALANHVQVLSQHMKAVIDAMLHSELVGP